MLLHLTATTVSQLESLLGEREDRGKEVHVNDDTIFEKKKKNSDEFSEYIVFIL